MLFSKPIKKTILGGHIFFENVWFYRSLKSCNEWVLAIVRCFQFSFLFLVMLILRVQNLGSQFVAEIGLYGKNPHIGTWNF